jgi:hypothetical protein
VPAIAAKHTPANATIRWVPAAVLRALHFLGKDTLISTFTSRSRADARLDPTETALFSPGDPQAILLDCLHLDPARPDRRALEALSPADWHQLVALAAQTNVSYQLYERLLQPRLQSVVPAEPIARLRSAVQEQTVRVLRLQATLVEILKACAAADLPVVVLKGMHLAHTVYDSPVARDMVDIDLLFRRRDMPGATAVFKSLGYEIPHDAEDMLDLAPANKEYTLRHPRNGSAVDVHWSLTEPPVEAPIDEPAVWSRARSISISGHTALGLAAEDLLAYLCFHASHHHYFAIVGLRPFVDVAHICRADGGLDWSAFADRVRAWGWARGVHLTLSIAQRYLGAPVPATVLTTALTVPLNAQNMQQSALGSAFSSTGRRPESEVNILRLWAADSLPGRFRLLLHRLFPSRGELVQEFGLTARQKLPPLPVLQLRRLGRLLPRHAPTLWNLRTANTAQRTALMSRRRLIAWLDANGNC